MKKKKIICVMLIFLILLIPSYQIPTVETGTRHRTAERTAKQTGELVISLSLIHI